MNSRFLAFALAMATLAGCSNDAPTNPVNAGSPVSLLTIKLNSDSTRTNFSSQMFFGSAKLDSSQWNLGQRPFFGTEAIVLENGDKVSVYSGITGASGLSSDGKFVPSFRVLSDWNVVEPENHRGIIWSGTTEFLLRTGGIAIDDNGNFVSELPAKFYTLSATGKNPSAKLTLQPVKGYQFVYPYQRFSFGCAGDDSVTVHSASGLIESQHDMYGDWVNPPYYIPDLTIICKTYSSASAANMARIAVLDGRKLTR